MADLAGKATNFQAHGVARKIDIIVAEKKRKRQNDVPGPRDNVEACRLASDLALERAAGRWSAGPR